MEENMKGYKNECSELPVAMLLSWILILVEEEISIPSVFGLDAGADMCREERDAPLQAVRLIWFLGLLR